MIFDTTVLLPLGLDEAFELVTQPARLRRWQTVAALTAQENGEALRCSHWLDGDEPRTY